MDDFELAKALFKQPKDTKTARIVSGTAYGASSDGSVQVDIDGSVFELPTNVSVKDGDTVQVTLSDRSPVVTGVVGWGDSVETEVGDARKVATNYIDYNDTDGVVVGNMTEGVLGANTQICVEDVGGNDKATINLRDGSTVLAKFQDDAIELGVNSAAATIEMCGGSARMFVAGDDFRIQGRNGIDSTSLHNNASGTGWSTVSSVTTNAESSGEVNSSIVAYSSVSGRSTRVQTYDETANSGSRGIWFNGAFDLGTKGNSGTSGQVLASQGSGSTPAWTSLASVATSGDYSDLSNTPAIPSLDWTLAGTFTTTANTITIGDCHEVMIVGSLWNDAMKVSSIFPPSEFAASTWYKIGGAYRSSSTNLDAEVECSAVSGSGSTLALTLKVSAAYVNSGDRSATSTFKVYTR